MELRQSYLPNEIKHQINSRNSKIDLALNEIRNSASSSIPQNSIKEIRRDALRDLNINEIEKLKEQFEELSPQKIIDDILKNSRKFSNSPKHNQSEKKDLFLENLKRSSIINFLENIKTKSLKEIKSEYEKRLDEYNTATTLYCDKKNKENLEYSAQLSSIKIKNQTLETTITQLNQENKLLKEQLKQSDNLIFKLQAKFEIFDRLKPIFEEFFKEYPNENPAKIMQDIKEKKEASLKLIEDLNSLQFKLIEKEKEKKEINEKNKKIIEDLSNKIYQLEENNKDKVENYLNEIHSLKTELSNYLIYKQENIKLHNMLFHLYNKLIERLSLERDIKINPDLKVTEKDFKPDLFDNEEIAQYIITMLANSHEDKSAKMLRETIAYANMMQRTYFKDNLNKKFDPVATFKNIKELLEKLESEKIEAKRENKLNKDKLKQFEIDVKKLQSELKYKQIQFENLEKKFNEQFSNKVVKSKEMNNQLRFRRGGFINIAEQESRTSNSNSATKSRKKGSLTNRARSAHPLKQILDRNKKNKDEETARDIFITEGIEKDNFNISKVHKKHQNKTIGNNSLTNRELKSASTRPVTARMLYVRPQSSVTLFKYKRNKIKNQKNKDKSNIITNEDDKDNNPNNIQQLNEEFNINNYKNIKVAKNGDKLLKSGIFQILPAHSDGFKSLVEHTNRLFIYKSKMKPDHGKKNIFDRFTNFMDKNISKLDKIKNRMEEKEYEIGNKIVTNINNLIVNLEKDD